MEFQPTNYSSTNFQGLKYVKPKNWNTQVLSTFMGSNLAKDIDKKYPKSKVSFSSFYDLFFDQGVVYSLKFKLAKGKEHTIYNNDLLPEYVANKMCERIKNTKLSTIEQEIEQKLKIKNNREDVVNAAIKSNKENSFFARLKKIFKPEDCNNYTK